MTLSAAFAVGDGETQCSKVRADGVRHGQFAESSIDKVMRFTPR